MSKKAVLLVATLSSFLPFLGGLLTQHLGWRSVFFMNIPLGALIVFFVLWKLRGEWAGAKGEKLDLIGSLIYSLSLVAIMSGFSLLPEISGLWLIMLGGGGGYHLCHLHRKGANYPRILFAFFNKCQTVVFNFCHPLYLRCFRIACKRKVKMRTC